MAKAKEAQVAQVIKEAVDYKDKPSVRLYAAGGTGTNIAKKLYKEVSEVEEGFARLDISFLDTSRSNIPGVKEEHFYHVKDESGVKDGSGGVRSENYDPIRQCLPEAIHLHKPGALNIILHSASGGSGSTAGPVLASELLSQEKNVVVILIGSTTSEKETENTMKTILSYQGVATTRKMPVNMMYFENSRETSMFDNNAAVVLEIIRLTALFSGENYGLDSQDLRSFLNYQRVSQHPPVLTGLMVKHGADIEIPKGMTVPSVVTLTDGEEVDPSPGCITSYHTFGVAPRAAVEAIQFPWPLHFYTLQGYYSDTVNRLKAKLAEMQDHRSINVVNTIKLEGVQVKDDGIVL